MCHDRQQIGNASEQELQTSLSYHRGWFILGQIFHGIGAAPILTLGNENPVPIFECKHNAFGAKCIFDKSFFINIKINMILHFDRNYFTRGIH